MLAMLVKALLIFWCLLFGMQVSTAAEWSAEPELGLMSIYDDNIGMSSNNEESSAGYSVAPRVKLEGREVNWDVGLTALLKATRYNDVEDVDSDNYFFTLANGYSTERQSFRLDGSFSRNTTFDTDFDTESPDAGLNDDHTERETLNLAPSWKWMTSESSSIYVEVSHVDVEYDETTASGYTNYKVDTATIKNIWNTGPRSQLGFTLSYTEYQNDEEILNLPSGDLVQYLEYNNTVYQLDYVYDITETSQLNLSLGRRKLESLSYDEVVGCSQVDPFTNSCTILEVDDVERSDDGTVVSLSYANSSEVSSINASVSRTVVPSSYGGAQEQEQATVLYKYQISERMLASLILDAKNTTSIDGQSTSDDRKRQRFEPLLGWKLTKFWNLELSYRFIKQNLKDTNTDSEANIIFVNLNMRWPRLVSTY